MRHPTRAAINKFNAILGLDEDPHMQDWEIECADPNRLAEFVSCYDLHALTADEKFTLMALILGSYEEYHDTCGPDDKEWEQIKDRLQAEKVIHCDHIDYYSCLETEDPEEWFPITPLIRSLHPKAAKHDVQKDASSRRPLA